MKIASDVGNVMYILAFVFVLLWAIGYIGYNFRGFIHVLLVLAGIAILIKIIKSI